MEITEIKPFESTLRHSEFERRLKEVSEEADKHYTEFDNEFAGDHEIRLSEQKSMLTKCNYTYDELLHLTALLIFEERLNDSQLQQKDIHIKLLELAIEAFEDGDNDYKQTIEAYAELVRVNAELVRAKKNIDDEREIIKAKLATNKRQIAAVKGHSQEGGSRGKRDRIIAIWATGKYTSRDICAEQESAALDMSFSTARKALRNTSDPT
jgi:hypothetical protein